MKKLKSFFAHLSLITSVTLLIPLIIDLFFNSAMGFINNSLYKGLFLVQLLCSAVSAALQIYLRKKK